MKKLFLMLSFIFLTLQPSQAWDVLGFINQDDSHDVRAVKKVLNSQVRYANKTDYDKFIATYDPKYINSDGFNLDVFSSLIKDVWSTYDNIKYDIEIKKVTVNDNKAVAEILEKSFANINLSKAYDGELKSESNTRYYLEKNKNGKWKVTSDEVLEETTSMLYGEAKGLDIKLTAPNPIAANTDYTATLEFVPPKETIAIASLATDKVEYPQKQTEEVFRALPEDNILERIFTSNNDNANEYVVASIGLTKTSVKDLNLRLSLIGFGYTIKRVNVLHEKKGTASINDKVE